MINYDDGRIVSEADLNNMPLTNTPPSGDMKRMSMKVGKITSVDKTKNTVHLEWLWPIKGGVDNIPLSRPYVGLKSGMNFIPEIGSIVVVGYTFNIPVILSYILPGDYKKMLDGQLDNNNVPTQLRQLSPGEISLNSSGGSEIYLHDQLELTDGVDEIILDPGTGTIQTISLNLNAINEGGNIFMGMIKRIVKGKPTIVTNDGESILKENGGNALNELTINMKEFADNSINDNAANPNIVTVTLGTLVDKNGKKVLNEVGKQIVLDIKFKSGARIQADKDGNLNLNEGKMTTPTDVVPPNIDPLSTKPSVNFAPLLSAQHAAREGDFISIPIVSSTDTAHPYMAQIALGNLGELAKNLAPYFRVFGVYPCIYTSGPPVEILGQIITGSSDVFIGSKDEKL
jgi:hypothetical protein